MTYHLNSRIPYNEHQVSQLHAALFSNGYKPTEFSEGVISYINGDSKVILADNNVELSFDYLDGRDREHLAMLSHIQHILNVPTISVDCRLELRVLQAAGINSKLLSNSKNSKSRFPQFA